MIEGSKRGRKPKGAEVRKSGRIIVRVTPGEEALIRYRAETLGMSVSAFMIWKSSGGRKKKK